MILRVALLTVFMSGCLMLGSGRDPDMNYVHSIKKCKTTEKDVIAHLGEPTSENDMGNLKQMVWYSRDATVVNPFDPKLKNKTVMVSVNPSGQVVGVGTTPMTDTCAKKKTAH